MKYTNRVYLPDNQTVYVSDDTFGEQRLEEIYKQYGNLRVEICERELGKHLHELTPVTDTTITDMQKWG